MIALGVWATRLFAQPGGRTGCCAKADTYLATLGSNVPSEQNEWHRDWVLKLDASLRRFHGSSLLPNTTKEACRALHEDEEVVCVSHGGDQIFNYANRAGLELFEMSWDEFVRTPSRESAPPTNQEERDELLAAVRRDNYVAPYRGLRVSSSGTLFYINDGIVWNVVFENEIVGQAALFSKANIGLA